MKRMCCCAATLLMLIVLIGCGTRSATEQKFDELAKTFPSEVTFANVYVEPSPKPVVINTTATVTIDDQELFIQKLVAHVYDSMDAKDLTRMMDMGFVDLGVPKDSTEIPDSLRHEYNAWIVSMSVLAYAAQEQDEYFTRLGVDDIDDFSHASVEMQSMKSVIPHEFGHVSLEKSYDYEHAPKGLIMID